MNNGALVKLVDVHKVYRTGEMEVPAVRGVSLSIANTGTTEIKQWTLGFDLEGDVRPGSGWNGTWQQQGTRATVTGLPGHTDLAAGMSVTDIGASIDGPHASGIPESFDLNGVQCRTASQP